jgi:putative ABC transport system permease protein
MRIHLKRDRLLALIARSNLSQNHWAMKLGLSRGHWSNIVNGKHPYPSARTRQLLVEAFGVPVEELFEVEAGPSLSDPSFQEAIASRYLIDRETGQGGMGTVYLARDVKLGRVVALKVVSPEAVSGVGVDRFLKEVGFVARLQHPHIVPLYEAGEAAGFPYYVMPFFRDGSLRDLLAGRQRLALAEALPLLRGIAGALGHAHAHQILHCDVKPGNVLLAGGHAYVADFGIARVLRSEALEWGRRGAVDSSAGTPAYVSPEQASGEPHLDGRSDLYSLGCVAFELLAGRPPFEGRTTMEIVARRFTTPVPDVRAFAPELPAAVPPVLERAMALNRAERQASVAELVRQLDHAAKSRVPAAVGAARLAVARAAGKLGLVKVPRLGGIVEKIGRDLRHALRGLARQPGFAAAAILTLAIGIGATTAIFSVVNAVLLRSLPYPEPHEVVVVWEDDLESPSEEPGGFMSHLNFVGVQERARGFERLAQYRTENLTLSGLGPAEVVPGGMVTPAFFDVLGAPPIVGRTFTADESRYQGPDAVIVGEAFWRTRLGGDPGVLETTLMVSGEPHTIVGIAPAGFDFPGDAQLWIPVQHNKGRGGLYLGVIGRLAAGWSIERARADLLGVAQGLRADYPDMNVDLGLAAAPLMDLVVGDVRTALWVLLGAVVVVLLIASANVANLILVRGGARRTELAVRTALGASRARIVGQLMTENAVLALGGGLAGLLLARWGITGLLRLAPEDLPRLEGVALDPTTLVFALGLVALTVLLFGLAPAMRLSADGVSEAMQRGARVVARGGQRVRRGVLIAQLTLSVMLLLCAGLMLRSLARMRSVDLGLDPEGVAVFHLTLPASRYDGPDQRVQFMAQLEDRLAAIPGVERVATTVAVPFGSVMLFSGFTRPDLPEPAPGEMPAAEYHVLDADALDVLGIRVVQGRAFNDDDRHGAQPVALVSEEAARRYWPGEDPIGKEIDIRISTGYDNVPRTVVGVVADFRTDVTQPPGPRMFVPYAQAGGSFPHVLLEYRGTTAASVLAAARRELASLDPELPMAQPATLDELVASDLAAPRFYFLLLGLFAAIALALAAVGIYGVVAYLVVQRTREIGMRMALGAKADSVIRMVMWQGVAPALAGVVLGLSGAVALGRVIRGILYEVEPTDPLTYVVTSIVLLGVVVAATWLPAHRASRIPPAEALRVE